MYFFTAPHRYGSCLLVVQFHHSPRGPPGLVLPSRNQEQVPDRDHQHVQEEKGWWGELKKVENLNSASLPSFTSVRHDGKLMPATMLKEL